MTTLELINSIEDQEKRYSWFCWWHNTLTIDQGWFDKLIELAYLKGKKDAMVDAQALAQKILIDGQDPYEVLNSLLKD
jgi:hypothetical protein